VAQSAIVFDARTKGVIGSSPARDKLIFLRYLKSENFLNTTLLLRKR